MTDSLNNDRRLITHVDHDGNALRATMNFDFYVSGEAALREIEAAVLRYIGTANVIDDRITDIVPAGDPWKMQAPVQWKGATGGRITNTLLDAHRLAAMNDDPAKDDEPPLGWCMADLHRNGNGDRVEHTESSLCCDWREDEPEPEPESVRMMCTHKTCSVKGWGGFPGDRCPGCRHVGRVHPVQ